MDCFKVKFDDLSVDEIIDMVNDDDLPDSVWCKGCRFSEHFHKHAGHVRECLSSQKRKVVNGVRRLIGKSAPPPKAARELFTPESLVRPGGGLNPLARVPTGMSAISASSITSLTPSRLAAAAQASGSSESAILEDYFDAVYIAQPPRLTDVDHPLFSANMVTHIQRMQLEEK